MKVLLVGPTSYLGMRLLKRLLNSDGVHLRLLVGDARRLGVAVRQNAEIVEGDTSDRDVLRKALNSVDVAYFPLRFFGVGNKFSELSRSFAENFHKACITCGVKRIIYLGIADGKDARGMLSGSAVDIGELLSSSPEKVSTVWLRTGFVIGSGSALFEALRNLIDKSPVLLIPKWMEMKITAIGVSDILEYLIQAKELVLQGSVVVDVGMSLMSFREMLTVSAQVMGMRRIFIPFPCKTHRLSALLLGLVTPFSFPASLFFIRLIDSGGNSLDIIKNDNSYRYFPRIALLSFKAAMESALKAFEKENVISRWTDSIADISYDDDESVLSKSMYRDIKKKSFGDIPPQRVFRAVKSIGGRQGWFTFDLLWRIRGLLDKFTGGFGTAVGRRVDSDLRIGDWVDVWKVVDIKEDRRLLLEAQMKVFGKAWLEFRIEGDTLIQTAYHYPKGLMGRLYWYSMLPFHVFIFRDMITAIVRRAREEE